MRPLRGHGCYHCQAPLDKLTPAFGHNTYFKCTACNGNTKIDFSCPNCRREARVRKDGSRYFWNCVPENGGCGFNEKAWG
jgi:hypothetical protein